VFTSRRAVFDTTYVVYTESSTVTASNTLFLYSVLFVGVVFLLSLWFCITVSVWFCLLSCVVLYTLYTVVSSTSTQYSLTLILYTTVLLLATPCCLSVLHGTLYELVLVVLLLEQHSYFAYRFIRPSYVLSTYVTVQLWLSVLLWYGVFTSLDFITLAFMAKLGLSLVAVFAQLLYAELSGWTLLAYTAQAYYLLSMSFFVLAASYLFTVGTVGCVVLMCVFVLYVFYSPFVYTESADPMVRWLAVTLSVSVIVMLGLLLLGDSWSATMWANTSLWQVLLIIVTCIVSSGTPVAVASRFSCNACFM